MCPVTASLVHAFSQIVFLTVFIDALLFVCPVEVLDLLGKRCAVPVVVGDMYIYFVPPASIASPPPLPPGFGPFAYE